MAKSSYQGRELLGAASVQKKYKKGRISIPGSKSDDLENDPKYFLAWAEYIFAKYVNGQTLVPYGGITRGGKSFTEINQYALGRQDPIIYQKLLDPCEEGKEEGFYNINWDIHPILPKFRDVVRGKLLGVDYEVNTQAIDMQSRKKRIETISKMKLAVNDNMKQLMAATGTRYDGVKVPDGIKQPADVDFFQKLGGVRLEREIMLKNAIGLTQYESDWPTLKDMLINSTIDYNIAALHTKHIQSTGKIKSFYISPQDLICRGSVYPDHRDIDFAGVLGRKTIAQIREENVFEEEELVKIARAYNGFNGSNQFDTRGDFFNIQPTDRGNVCDNINEFKVDTLEFYFIAKKAENYVVGYRENEGNMIYDKVKSDSKLSKKDMKKGKKLQENEVEYVFRAEWIIGTEYIFNYGIENTIVKEDQDGVKRARLPITIYSDTAPSLMERCIAHVDDIHIAIYKLRNAISKHIPAPRIIFDLSVLESSVSMGGKTYDMMDLIENFTKTGVMVMESKSEYDDERYGASNKKPFEFVNNAGIESDIAMFLQRIATSLEQIRQVTGVNEVADGTTVNQDMLKGVMEGLTAATNNALKPTFRVYEGVYENWARYCGLKWQTAVLGGDIDITYTPLNDTIIRHFKLTKDLYGYDFGIKILLRPSEQEKQMMLQDIMAKKEQQLLASHDYFVLHQMINNGDIRQAQVYYSRAVEEQRQKNHQQNIEMQTAQAKAQGEAGMALEQAKAQTIQVETQSKIQLLNLEYQWKEKLLDKELAAKGELEGQKLEANIGNTVLSKSLDKSMQTDKE